MATSKEYKDFILEQLDLLDNITCRAMMGEFLLYYNDIFYFKGKEVCPFQIKSPGVLKLQFDDNNLMEIKVINV